MFIGWLGGLLQTHLLGGLIELVVVHFDISVVQFVFLRCFPAKQLFKSGVGS